MPRNHSSTVGTGSNWKGGRVVDPRGYVLIRVGSDHHLSDIRGYAYEHRIVAEEKIGRRLRSKEHVHHINEDKSDNRPMNLEVFPSLAHHFVAHRRVAINNRLPGAPNPVISCACGCGARFKKYDQWKRPRKIRAGHNASAKGGQAIV